LTPICFSPARNGEAATKPVRASTSLLTVAVLPRAASTLFLSIDERPRCVALNIASRACKQADPSNRHLSTRGGFL
jgi:hypothetical protein